MIDKCWYCGADVEVEITEEEDNLYNPCYCLKCLQIFNTKRERK